MYLWNTKRICEQHNAALKDVNDIILKALVLSEVNLPKNAVHEEGATDTEMNLDDED